MAVIYQLNPGEISDTSYNHMKFPGRLVGEQRLQGLEIILDNFIIGQPMVGRIDPEKGTHGQALVTIDDTGVSRSHFISGQWKKCIPLAVRVLK